MGLGLYIHIPFCKSKCRYCDFASFSGCEDRMEAYIASLIAEMGLWSERFQNRVLDTVYIGGGTPSFLPEGQIEKLMNGARRYFPIKPDAETTLEANPGTLSKQKLQEYHDSGINRLSMGLQSANEAQLKMLGRIHTFDDFRYGFEAARDAGFKNISIDLIFGIPGQTAAGWTQTLKAVIPFEPEHISCYGLKIEEGTPLHSDHLAGRIILPSEDETLEMIHTGEALLSDSGYKRYEISNYAKPGRESLHNLNYWDCGEYLGVGLGAHSCIREDDGLLRRFENKRTLDGYSSDINIGGKPVINIETISTEMEIFEYVMLRLRLAEGIVFDLFTNRFGLHFEKMFESRISRLCSENLANEEDRHFHLTSKGLDVQNQVILYLMPN